MNFYYTQSFLPNAIFKNSDFFRKTVAPVPQNLQYFVAVDMFKQACEARKIEYKKPLPIKNITADIKQNSNYNVLFVEFDPSFYPGDSDTITIAIAVGEKDIRYFTYERGQSFATGKETTFVCEVNEKGNHINYGTTSERRTSLFSGKIMPILNNK